MTSILDETDLPYEWPWLDEEGNRRLPTPQENPTWYTPYDQLRGSLKPVQGRCGSKLRKTEPPRYCMAKPSKGSTVCRIHGGKSPKGLASPHLREGRYSKYMPKGLRPIAKEAYEDPELLSLRDELVVQTSWIAHKLNEFNKTPPPDYSTILSVFHQLRKAKKPEDQPPLMDKLEELLQRGRSVAIYHASLEESIRTLIQDRTKTAQAEWKRLHDLNALVPFDQVLVMLDNLLMAVRDVVADERKLSQIQEVMQRLMPTDTVVITTSSQRNDTGDE